MIRSPVEGERKSQPVRMQEETLRAPAIRDVAGAPYSRSPTIGWPMLDKMHPNLVRAAGSDPHFEGTLKRPKLLEHPVFGQRRSPDAELAVMRVRRTGSRVIGVVIAPFGCFIRPCTSAR